MIVEDFIEFDKEHLSGNKTPEERVSLISGFMHQGAAIDNVKLRLLISALERRQNRSYQRLIQTLEDYYLARAV